MDGELGTETSEQNSEQEYIRRVLAGEREAFRYLVQLHEGAVTRIIQRQVSDHHLVQDLVQETFVKAYRGLASFRFQARFSTWLIRIALNTTNSYFSSSAWKKRTRTMSFDPLAHQQFIQNASDDAFSEEMIERLKLAVAALKPKFREVIVLCAFEQNSYEDAAAILRIPIGTVRSRLNSARLVLKDMLKEGSR